ncbi:hypothetical protein HDK77DRAFT_39445 [Phyllosticta capitalensis]
MASNALGIHRAARRFRPSCTSVPKAAPEILLLLLYLRRCSRHHPFRPICYSLDTPFFILHGAIFPLQSAVPTRRPMVPRVVVAHLTLQSRALTYRRADPPCWNRAQSYVTCCCGCRALCTCSIALATTDAIRSLGNHHASLMRAVRDEMTATPGDGRFAAI